MGNRRLNVKYDTPDEEYSPKKKSRNGRLIRKRQLAICWLAIIFVTGSLLFLLSSSSTSIPVQASDGSVDIASTTDDDASCPYSTEYDFVPCNATHFDMRYDLFDCGPYELTKRKFLNESQRMLLRGVYMGVVGYSRSSVTVSFGHGFGFPIDLKYNEKGRAVYAATDIPKGSLVWDSRRNTVCFDDASLYRQFILSLPRSLVCEALSFSYVSTYLEAGALSISDGDKQRPLMCVDTDEGGQLNDGHEHEQNIGCPPDKSKAYCNNSGKMYALRDIQAGEELLCWYDGVFALDFGWDFFGMDGHSYIPESTVYL